MALLRRASMATVIRPDPYLSAACRMSSGFFTAALFMEILEAPAPSTSSTSSRLLIPPPTVSGIVMTAET
ncbi:MAG: hypothetical protein A4E67_01587 [Syntrophaceae bacterium PtaB.Bin038]|nr:MAG: hypothetical protein A4E67_01587 [Syntrophaceae bacterium PtaB.Bin038]